MLCHAHDAAEAAVYDIIKYKEVSVIVEPIRSCKAELQNTNSS